MVPLTGLSGSAADAARPAVALLLAGSSVQGLASADVVFEEIAAPVRYIAVFQSRAATGVGPITSTQPTDGRILSVLHPLVGYDGAQAPFFLKVLDKAKITDVGFGSHPSFYSSGPQGLLASTRAISRAVRGAGAPPQLFSYRGGDSGNTLASTGVSRPTSVRVVIPGGGTQRWTFDSKAGRWVLVSGGPKFQAANLVIQTVSYKRVSVSRRQGIVVPVAQVIGTGRAEVLSGSSGGGSGGTAAAGTWSKPGSADVTNYFDASGSPMAFQPGPTWIILAPRGTQVQMSGAH